MDEIPCTAQSKTVCEGCTLTHRLMCRYEAPRHHPFFYDHPAVFCHRNCRGHQCRLWLVAHGLAGVFPPIFGNCGWPFRLILFLHGRAPLAAGPGWVIQKHPPDGHCPGRLVYLLGVSSPMPISRLFNWAIGLTALSVFAAAELQGMSPLMRGEQGNWKWEGLIGAVLALLYWLVPLGLGWR